MKADPSDQRWIDRDGEQRGEGFKHHRAETSTTTSCMNIDEPPRSVHIDCREGDPQHADHAPDPRELLAHDRVARHLRRQQYIEGLARPLQPNQGRRLHRQHERHDDPQHARDSRQNGTIGIAAEVREQQSHDHRHFQYKEDADQVPRRAERPLRRFAPANRIEHWQRDRLVNQHDPLREPILVRLPKEGVERLEELEDEVGGLDEGPPPQHDSRRAQARYRERDDRQAPRDD